MRKFVLSISAGIMFLCLFPVCGFSFQNEPDGFRGIKWGSNLDEISGMKLTKDEVGVKTYKKSDDKRSIGGAKLMSISYHTYKDQFYQVSMLVEFESSFKALKNALYEAYDAPQKQSAEFDPRESYKWSGKKAEVEIIWRHFGGVGVAIFTSVPLIKEKEKDQAKEGLKDL